MPESTPQNPSFDWAGILTGDILPWWEAHGADDARGGVLTCFNNAGQLQSTEKYTWSQGRWAWLAAELADDAEAGRLDLDAATWRRRAGGTAGFLLEHAVLPDGRTAFRTDADGSPLPSGPDGELSTSVFADLFAALGIGAAVRIGAAEDPDALLTATVILETAHASIADRSARTEPYPVPDGYEAMAGWMNLLHTSAELLRAAPDRDPGGLRERITAMRDESVSRLLGAGGESPGFVMLPERSAEGVAASPLPAEGGATGTRPAEGGAADAPSPGGADWFELRPDDPQHRASLLARHRTPGHLLELLWMLLHADPDGDGLPADGELEALALHALAIGWDDRHGGLLRYADVDGGPPRAVGPDADGPDADGPGSASPYAELVRTTWSTKLWWVHSEALYATDLLARRTGSAELAGWHDRLARWTMEVFPDTDRGEWIQIRRRDGTPSDEVVALPVKDPFHIARSLLLLARSCPGRATFPGTSSPAPDADPDLVHDRDQEETHDVR